MGKKLEYGLVLGGGGTKGAYQVGVWKALKELKINIKAITGTSIGALNGALFLQDDIKKMESLYRNIEITDVISGNVDIDTSKDIFDVKNIFSLMGEFLKQKGLDNTALKETMLRYIDMDKVYKSKIDLGVVAFSMKALEGIEAFKKDIPKEDMLSYLLASACFPIFKAQKIKDAEYFDGGLADVIPINMMIKHGINNIIAVDVAGPGILRSSIDKNAHIKLIHSQEDLGGVFEFNKEKIDRNIKLGYLDTLRSFHKLQGNMFYLNNNEFAKLLNSFNV